VVRDSCNFNELADRDELQNTRRNCADKPILPKCSLVNWELSEEFTRETDIQVRDISGARKYFQAVGTFSHILAAGQIGPNLHAIPPHRRLRFAYLFTIMRKFGLTRILSVAAKVLMFCPLLDLFEQGESTHSKLRGHLP